MVKDLSKIIMSKNIGKYLHKDMDNEAGRKALAKNLEQSKLNVLALDDLLISLDMSNREVVLRLLFKEYQTNYQLLIFTHDKQFFNIAKQKIEGSTFKNDWLFWEFYVNEKVAAIPKPRLFEDETGVPPNFQKYLRHCFPVI